MTLIVMVNDKTVNVDLDGINALSELLVRISETVFEPDELIEHIYINGEPVKDISDPGYTQKPISAISALRIITLKNPAERLIELLGKMDEYLTGMTPGLARVADSFRMGSSEEANSMLLYAIEGITAFTELIQSSKIIMKPETREGAGEDGSMESLEERLLTVLKDLQAGQEAEDWVTVADVLEYELAPLMDEWKSLIPSVQEELLKRNN